MSARTRTPTTRLATTRSARHASASSVSESDAATSSFAPSPIVASHDSAAPVATDTDNPGSALPPLQPHNQRHQQLFGVDAGAALAITRIESISVKNVTSKSGLTQAAHHVCKNSAFDIHVRGPAASSADAIDFTRCVLACRLVYDAGQPPFKQVDFPAKSKPISYSAAVERDSFVLSVKLGVLSSQVEGELFRVEIEAARADDDAAPPLRAYTPPIAVVSKPYLALRKEGERGKPTPRSAAAAGSNKRRRSQQHAEPSVVAVHSGQSSEELHASLQQLLAEQSAQRRLLEQLMQQQQQQQHQQPFVPSISMTDSDDDREYADSDADEQESAYHAAKRRRRSSPLDQLARKAPRVLTGKTVFAPADNANNNADWCLATEREELTPLKRLDGALDSLIAAFDALPDVDVELGRARLRAVLPRRIVSAFDAAAVDNEANVCDMFVQGCPHKRELDKLDAFYEMSMLSAADPSAEPEPSPLSSTSIDDHVHQPPPFEHGSFLAASNGANNFFANSVGLF